MKNWKKRYFVVNPDYSVDYFENEEVCEFLLHTVNAFILCGGQNFQFTMYYNIRYDMLHNM